ncbi:GNAT family N-acetyltransferase [Oerskovia enterophila]|uniref:GNAT family N-acetyltransferase n=1 Tax=Oerskovia enterophila TaxID=43678 RepID=UPI0037F2F6E0
MSEQTQAITIVDNPEQERFEARTPEGDVAGFAAYVRQPGQVVFTHTEVDDVYAGNGIGSSLARGALDQVRASGDKVVPLCPFIRAFVQLHEEYQDLIAR